MSRTTSGTESSLAKALLGLQHVSCSSLHHLRWGGMYIRSLKADIDEAKYIDSMIHKQFALVTLKLSNLISDGTADVGRLGRGVRSSCIC